jgi:hypothetical protein
MKDDPVGLSVGTTSNRPRQHFFENSDESPHHIALWLAKEIPISPRTVHVGECDAQGSCKDDEHRQDDLSDPSSDPASVDVDDVHDPPSSSEDSKSSSKESASPDVDTYPTGSSGVEEQETCEEEEVTEAPLQTQTRDGHIRSTNTSGTPNVPLENEATEVSSTPPPPDTASDADFITIEAMPSLDESEQKSLLRHSVSCGGRFSSVGLRKNMCPSFPSTDESLQAAIEGMMAKLSPSASRRLGASYYEDSENNEFLNNYFYCVKPKEIPKLKKKEDQQYAPDEHQANDAYCHAMGVDTVMSGISFLFSANPGPPSDYIIPHQAARERALSLGRDGEMEMRPDGWLGMLGMSSHHFKFSFINGSEKPGENSPFHFQPPCLKKCVDVSSPGKKPQGGNVILQSSSTEQRGPSTTRNSDSKFEAIFGVSREEFMSLSKVEKWLIVEKNARKITEISKAAQ